MNRPGLLAALRPLIVLLLLAPAPLRAERLPLPEGVVRAAIEAGWKEHVADGATLEIVRVPELIAPADALLTVSWPDHALGAGPRALTLDATVDGRTLARGLANVIVRREFPVWVLVRDVGRGGILSPDDAVQEMRSFDRPPTTLMLDDAPPRGWTARRALTAGSVLRARDVKALPDVEAGQEILLVSRVGDAAVSVPARVRRAGSVGDRILVSNPVTGDVVSATLVDANTAELVGARHDSRERSDS